jgi:hypothetical protein
MKSTQTIRKLGSTALLAMLSLSFTQSSSAVDPFTAAVLIGGLAVSTSQHASHYSYVHSVPSYRYSYVSSAPTTRVISLGSYGYVSPQYMVPTQHFTTVSYLRSPVRGHSCGYDGICLGH